MIAAPRGYDRKTYPLDNGGKIKSYTTINALATAGNQIDLVCFTEQQDIQENF